jgi:hypothetical protein
MLKQRSQNQLRRFYDSGFNIWLRLLTSLLPILGIQKKPPVGAGIVQLFNCPGAIVAFVFIQDLGRTHVKSGGSLLL